MSGWGKPGDHGQRAINAKCINKYCVPNGEVGLATFTTVTAASRWAGYEITWNSG